MWTSDWTFPDDEDDVVLGRLPDEPLVVAEETRPRTRIGDGCEDEAEETASVGNPVSQWRVDLKRCAQALAEDVPPLYESWAKEMKRRVQDLVYDGYGAGNAYRAERKQRVLSWVRFTPFRSEALADLLRTARRPLPITDDVVVLETGQAECPGQAEEPTNVGDSGEAIVKTTTTTTTTVVRSRIEI